MNDIFPKKIYVALYNLHVYRVLFRLYTSVFYRLDGVLCVCRVVIEMTTSSFPIFIAYLTD